MALFLGSFLVFLLAALALGIGIIVNGKPMSAGCRSLPGEPDCDSKSLCGGVCRRRNLC